MTFLLLLSLVCDQLPLIGTVSDSTDALGKMDKINKSVHKSVN